ncbi:hypothetical protein KDL01_01890 [Actinospica durhamensis]|uniref:Integral membrane protein n=1 Tax=Actinospica durhamensis TaxID=1508375 RepID=A0A941IKL9_9ACTN|nr:hypothetical protein [Actinospica durhamensis]MBR7831990.1 hypothetical protein [Actinospica durhamensis]
MPETPAGEATRPWTSPSTAVTPPNTGPTRPAGPAPAATPLLTAPGRPARRREFRQRPIPLRPMTVLELIDGAIGALPTLPRFLLVRAAAVITACGAVALALTWWFNRAVSTAVQAHPMWISTNLIGDTVASFAPSKGERVSLVTTEILIAVVCSGFAATVVAGLFAPSVKAYVDAEPADATALRTLLRGRVARLYALALITSLPRIVMTVLFGLMAWSSAIHPGSIVAGWYVLVLLALGIPCVLLTATTAVAAPAAALEGIGVAAALRRSRRLARRGVLRIAWTCLLTLLIVAAATAALDVIGAELRKTYGVGAQFAALPGSPGFSWWLLTYALVYLLTGLLTTPYRAATAVLVYVDRRFRREGLDIRIAWARLAQIAPRRGSGGPSA